MIKAKLAANSQEYSRIIAGVMRWGKWGAQLSSKELSELINSCIDCGVTTFDHADIYGDHTTEEEFGKAFLDSGVSRSEMQLITKCGIKMLSPACPDNKIKSYDTSKAYIISSVEKSLRHLKTDYIDLLLIHRPGPLMRVDEIAGAFTQLRKDGKVLDFGVSNFTASQFDFLHSHFPLVTNQIELSMVQLGAFEDGTIENTQKNGVSPQAWSPLGGAELFEPQSKYDIVMRNSRLNSVRSDYNWTLSQMALLFLLHHPAQVSPVLGTTKSNRIRESVDCLSQSITDEQWYEIWTASKGAKVP
jgi:predicted oxidoreductase